MDGILSIWNDRDDQIAELYESWYVREHVPERLGIPGFLAAYRYQAVRGAPHFMTYYRLTSPRVLSSPEYLAKVAAPTELTRRIMAQFRHMTRTACTLAYRSDPGAMGGYVASAYAEMPAAIDADRLLQHALAVRHEPHVLSVQIWRAAPDSANPANRESRLRPGGDRTIEAAIVIDVMREQDALHIEESAAVAIRRSLGTEASTLRSGVYRLLGAWHSPDSERLRAQDLR
ncbi:MAG TPA: hypothetical protein VIQ55_12110 [Burkholderiales bacterium]|jgi:hypothetical protein